MGNATWSAEVYSTRRRSYAGKSREQIFQKKTTRQDFDPKNINIRESCDSEANPLSTAMIIGLDVTGSMGFIAEKIAKEGLGTLVEGILDKKPVTDPHLMMMALGDIRYDHHPLQVTQFEADIRIADQLTDLYLEGGGGGNNTESYDLAWAFAAAKTKIDCWDKRETKGYIFTIGDECAPESVDNDMMVNKVNVDLQSNMTAEQILKEAQKRYHVFHVIVEEGSHPKRYGLDRVLNSWTKLLGKRVLLLRDYHHISEVVISATQVSEGMDPDEAIAQWQSDSIKESVRRALYGIGQ